MKKIMRKNIISALCCGFLATATLGVAAGITASADSVRVKPTGLNANTLTAEINDADLDTFKVYGASVRKAEPNGFRFLATIEDSDLALIPNNAEFGTLLIPYSKLGDAELTATTKSVLVAPALVDTDTEGVPSNGLGYYITLTGETLENAFPEGLYNTVLAARAYVKYTYVANGETITDYAYSSTTVCRSIAYVASCELAAMEKEGNADLNSNSFLNKIIAQTTEDASFSLSATELSVGEKATASFTGVSDGVNAFAYNLTSSNEKVAIINANGEVEAVGGGTVEITATLGAKKFTVQLTVSGAKLPTEFISGNILYSTQDGVIFMPNGLLDENETVASAVGATDGVAYFNQGDWSALALTEAEIKANAVGEKTLTLETSDGDLYNVKALSYAGVIDELSDFPAFFNNTAVPSEKDPATYPAVAPNTYGYYIVTKNLGSYTVEVVDKQTVYTYSDELSFTQEFKTDYEKNNGFNGVLDGAGHTLKFKLMQGGLVGKILGNAVIKNLSIIYEDASFVANKDDGGGYGVFGYMTNGSPEIRNCYIERTNNVQARASVYGLMARPNGKLILHNTVVYGFNCTLDATWFSKTNISSASTNAYVICGRSALTGFGMSANFTKVYTDGWGQPYDSNGNKLFVPLADVADASGFDGNYWNKETNISWKGADDMAVSVYDEKYVIVLEDELLYSTVNNEMVMPAGINVPSEAIVSAYDADGTVYFENGAWTNAIALTADEIKANTVKKTVLYVDLVNGSTYQVTVKSYAGVIDELSDFPTFFNNTATEAGVAPNVYGYYIVTKDLGTGVEELSFTQTAATDFTKTNGFNGVLDGQGHTLRFKLMNGGLVGLVLGNAVIKNLGVVYEDATSTYYGAFGYITNGAPEIRNCYIERTNNRYEAWSVFGIMSRPNAKLILHNTVVYAYNTSNNSEKNSNMWISSASTNAYLIHARANATSYVNVKNFTKVFNDGIENGSREVLLSEIADNSGFDNNYWYKENGKLIWKGLETVTVSWVNGDSTVLEAVTKDGVISVPALADGMYWATNTEGANKLNGQPIKINSDRTFYACASIVEKELSTNALYSTVDNEFFLPSEISSMSKVTSITSVDGATVYYENGAWAKTFALTGAEINANQVVDTVVKVYGESFIYTVTVKSYAGVIDELSDFPKFFNTADVPSEKDPATYPTVAPNVYGYYIVTKSLGTGAEELSFTQTANTDFTANNGFNGVLDGAGHTLKFKLMKGGLVGLILGTCTIKNLSVIYADATSTYYGVFGYMTNGNPVIDNCYIERTNNPFQKWSVFGIMSRPNAKLILHNTIVYGYNTSNNSEMNRNMWISAASTNAYLIHARANAMDWVNVQNFTKVYNDGIENGAREVPLADVADASGFNGNYWNKETNISWKGAADMAVSSVGEVTVEYQNLADNGASAYALVLPTNADDTLVTAGEEFVDFFTQRRA